MYLPALSDLPSALLCSDGTRVTTAAQWEAGRRGEILDLFLDNVYGRVPETEHTVTHTAVRSETETAVSYRITVTTETAFGSHSFGAYAVAPKKDAPAPVFELIQFPYQDTGRIEEILLPAGYAFARFFYPEVCADDDNDFSRGIHAVLREPGPRRENAWGAVAGWAWAASRLMDVLETLPEFDTSRAALAGHSRTGKASLLCGALDARFRLVCSNESGCADSAVTRGKQGEHVADICRGFPCGFCGRYRTFGENEYEGIDDGDTMSVFSLSEDGALRWEDGHENMGQDLQFTDIGRFEGVWRNEEEEIYAEFWWRGLFDEETYFYDVFISRGGAEQYANFSMEGLYNPESGLLEASGTVTTMVRNAAGSYDITEDDEICEAFFRDLGDGKLLYETDNGIELEYDVLGPES